MKNFNTSLHIFFLSSYEKDLPPLASCPRGMVTIPHFLRKFGHRLTCVKADTLSSLKEIPQLILKQRPNVIFTMQRSAFYAAILKKLGKISTPIIHAWDDYYALQSSHPKWLAWPAEKFSVLGTDYIVTASPYNLHLAKKWGVPSEFIPHGISEEREPTSLKLQSSRLKILYLGTQDRYKRSFELVKAVQNLDCDLFMIGSINTDVQNVAPSNVYFMGSIPQSQVYETLIQADILVNPTDQDSNFKIYDYLSARKPILGIKGKQEWFFKNGENALLVENLRQGIQQLINDSLLREKLAYNTAQLPLFTWEQIAKKHEAALLRLAN